METNIMFTFNTIADFIADTQAYNHFRIIGNRRADGTPLNIAGTQILCDDDGLVINRTLTYPVSISIPFVTAQKTVINGKVIYLVALADGETLLIHAKNKLTNSADCMITDFDFDSFNNKKYLDLVASHFQPMSNSCYYVVSMDAFGKLSYIQEQKINRLLETTTKLYIRDMAKTIYFKVDNHGTVEVGVYDLDQERFLRGIEIEVEDIDFDCLILVPIHIYQ